MSAKNIKIMVVTHKEAPMPKDKLLYIPTLVGGNKDNIDFPESYRDDSGVNISEKNTNYCELTALYWAWKNLDADYIGLVHYRRLFVEPRNKKEIASIETISNLLNEHDVILPKKRNYYIETTESHYKHNHNIDDLMETKKILEEFYPKYVSSFDRVMKETKSHRFNMMVMKKEKFDEYTEWLFAILVELEKRVDISNYDAYQSRIFGFISERLLDVWIYANDIKYSELPVKFMEKQNWPKKIAKFLKAKLTN